MSEIAQNYTSGAVVYGRVLRIDPFSGERKVWNTVNTAWEDYIAGSVADYTIGHADSGESPKTAIEEGATGNYVIEVDDTIAPDGEPRWLEWYVRASSVPLNTDDLVANYLFAFDAESNSFLPPSMTVASVGTARNVNIEKVGGHRVSHPQDLGSVNDNIVTDFAAAAMPSGASLNGYQYAFNDDAKYVRDAQTLDLSQPFELECGVLVGGTAKLFVGFGKPAVNIEDISANLLLPDETSSTKDQFYLGLLFQPGELIQFINETGNGFNVFDTAVAFDEGAVVFVWDPVLVTMDVFYVVGNDRSLLIQINEFLALSFFEATDAAFAFTANPSSGSAIVRNVVVAGPGYRGGNVSGFLEQDRVLVGTPAVSLAADIAGVSGGGTSEPRQNYPAGPAFHRVVSSRDDKTHEVTRPVRLRPGPVGPIAVAISMARLFGGQNVTLVGEPIVVPSGSLLATAIGPRDSEAMISLAGSPIPSEEYAVTVPVTLARDGPVRVDIRVIAFDA